MESTYLEIEFADELSRTVADRTTEMVQKATAVNPIYIRRYKYDCSILGDGTVQHFNFPDHPLAASACNVSVGPVLASLRRLNDAESLLACIDLL